MSPIDSTPSSNGVARASWADSWNDLKVDHDSPGYCRVTFDPRGETLEETIVEELEELIGLIEADPDLRVVVFDSARPDVFLSRGESEHGRAWLDALRRLSRAPVVSIASIRGRARGAGADFVIACDLRFASRDDTALARLMADEVDAIASRLSRFDHEALVRTKSPVDERSEA